MNIRFRFLVILLFIGLAGKLLYPTIEWYFRTPDDRKTLANGSKEQIREYSKKQAAVDLELIKDLAVESPKNPIPEDFDFLVDTSKKNYKLEKRELPEKSTTPETGNKYN